MAHCHPLPPLHIGNLSCRPLHTQSTPSQEEERRRTQHTRNEHPFKYSNITILLYYQNIISSRARAPPSRHLVFGGLCILPDYFTTLLLYLSDTTLLYYYTTLLIHPLARACTVVSSSRVRRLAVVASVVYCLDENNPSTTHSAIPSLYQGSVSPHWTRSHSCS